MTKPSKSSKMEQLLEPTGDTAESPPVPTEERQQRIALAAYYLAEQRGFSPGGELADWLEAEKQINANLDDES